MRAFALCLLTSCAQIPDFSFPILTSLMEYDDYACGLEEGDLVCFKPTGTTLHVAIAGEDLVTIPRNGGRRNCALRSDGTIRCWSLEDFATNQLDGVAPPPGTFTAIGAGSWVAASGKQEKVVCGVHDDGSIDCRTSDRSASADRLRDDKPSVASKSVGVGGTEVCALGVDRVVRCWGDKQHAWDGTFDELVCANFSCFGRRGDTKLFTPDIGVIDTERPFVSFTFSANFLCLLTTTGGVECNRLAPFEPFATIASTDLTSIVIEEGWGSGDANDSTWLCGLTRSGVPRCYSLPDGKALPLFVAKTRE